MQAKLHHTILTLFAAALSVSACKKTANTQDSVNTADARGDFEVGTVTFDAAGNATSQFVLRLDLPAALQPGAASLPSCGDPYGDNVLVGYVLCNVPEQAPNAQPARVDIFAKNAVQACYDGFFTSETDPLPPKVTPASATASLAGCTEGKVFQTKLNHPYNLFVK